jgi:hypothetical protein
MPGPISDSYDPEFSTGANATLVREAIESQRNRITNILGEKLINILDIVYDDFRRTTKYPYHISMHFTERELRIIRFALNRAIESI